MDNQDRKKDFKAPGNEDYDINRPQNLAKPAFNSASENRDNHAVPPIENLNQQNDEDDQLKQDTAHRTDQQGLVNDESLHGNDHKTDLGNGETPEDKDDEKLIRK